MTMQHNMSRLLFSYNSGGLLTLHISSDSNVRLFGETYVVSKPSSFARAAVVRSSAVER